jgi:GNAT superfamily N-acetyltransferase
MFKSDSHEALAASLVLALEHDPFYEALLSHVPQPLDRRPLLHDYFLQALQACSEESLGIRCVDVADHRSGVAIWWLPTKPTCEHARTQQKLTFMAQRLGSSATQRYETMTHFMADQVPQPVAEGAWYLSIVGLHPLVQGTGLGHVLLQPTLSDADATGSSCYLETFSERACGFYARNGFIVHASHVERVTGHEYWLMVREPQAH